MDSRTRPADVLARIADDRRRSIEALKLQAPPHVLRARMAPVRPAGRLERPLRRGGSGGAIRLLCEVKRISPSKGVLRADADPVGTARLYEAGGAAGISLVTEPDHFGGSLDWIDDVRPTTSLPLLLKDFVVDPYQLLDAAVRGADAVLLMAALLSEGQLQRFITEARLLGLDTLVEVHDEEELSGAVRAGATLVGINNRNLRTLEVDPNTAVELLPRVPPLVTGVA